MADKPINEFSLMTGGPLYRMKSAVGQFLQRGLIGPEDGPRFEEAIGSALRWRDSAVIELLLIVLSFTAGHRLWRGYLALHVATWYADGSGEHRLTSAGLYYALVSLPIFRFLIGRRFYRIFI